MNNSPRHRSESSKRPSGSEIVHSDPLIQTFFRLLWNNELCREFFLAHPSEIFLSLDEHSAPFKYIPYLYYVNIPKDSSLQAMRIIQSNSDNRESARDSLMLMPAHDMRDSEETIKNHAISILFYHIARLLKKNPELQKIVNDPLLTYASMVSAADKIKLDWDVFAELENIELLWTNDGQIPEGDKALNDILIKMLNYVKLWISDLTKSGDIMGFSAQNEFRLMSLHHAGYTQQVNILRPSRRYSELLNELYTRKLISNLQTIYWCSHCMDDSFISATHSRLSPHQLHFFCPKCERETCVTTAYRLYKPIVDMFFRKDGLLGASVSWLLEHSTIRPDRGQYFGDTEVDFLFTHHKQKIMLECKQHKIPQSVDSLDNILMADAKQFQRALSALNKSGIKIDKNILLTNISTKQYKTEIEALRHRQSKVFHEGFLIMDCSDFQQFLKTR